jgi:hypothetical protein
MKLSKTTFGVDAHQIGRVTREERPRYRTLTRVNSWIGTVDFIDGR